MNHVRANEQASESGPETAVERLQRVFARHQDELLGMLYYLVGNIEDARDCVQETFVKCWRHRLKAGEVDNLRAWIFRIALNTGRDMRTTAWRRRKRSLDGAEHFLAASGNGPEDDAARKEQLALVRQAVLRLRCEEQEVFLLRQNGDMTYEQIAEAIEIPVGTVKTRMRLALSKLRAALEPKRPEAKRPEPKRPEPKRPEPKR